MTAALTVVAPVFAAAAKSSSSGAFIYLLLIVGVGFYFLIYRPQQRKAKALREQSNTFEVGDEVLTAGGIVGYVIEVDGDRVTLETSVGASFVVLKQYVIRRLDAAVPDDSDVPDDSEAEDHSEAENEPEEHEESDAGEEGHGADAEDHTGHEFEDESHTEEAVGDATHAAEQDGDDTPGPGVPPTT
jgi:preprotein translocase subunit YajC